MVNTFETGRLFVYLRKGRWEEEKKGIIWYLRNGWQCKASESLRNTITNYQVPRSASTTRQDCFFYSSNFRHEIKKRWVSFTVGKKKEEAIKYKQALPVV